VALSIRQGRSTDRATIGSAHLKLKLLLAHSDRQHRPRRSYRSRCWRLPCTESLNSTSAMMWRTPLVAGWVVGAPTQRLLVQRRSRPSPLNSPPRSQSSARQSWPSVLSVVFWSAFSSRVYVGRLIPSRFAISACVSPASSSRIRRSASASCRARSTLDRLAARRVRL
jgi:hypothetical protein